MTFIWPWMLLSLAALPLVVLWYRRLLRARVARRAELAELGLVATQAPARRRGVPAILMLVAVGLLLAALARPEAEVPQPRREGTVILAMDVSGSMAAADLRPTRIEAAKAAARAFVAQQPDTIRIGVVAFGGTGVVTQEVTSDRTAVLAAVDRLNPQGATALGGGMQAALAAIVGRPVLVGGPDTASSGGTGSSVEPRGPDLGYHGSAVIVLLTDGENTGDPDPLDVADLASAAGVKVYPVGLGSPEGAVVEIDGFQVATALDEQLLREIAERTDGRYVPAPDEQLLAGIADAVDPAWTVAVERVEVTGLVAAVAGLLLLTGVALALAWTGRAL
ncbi:MAG: VWA domain-containing protein [Pseudonocardia sp.]